MKSRILHLVFLFGILQAILRGTAAYGTLKDIVWTREIGFDSGFNVKFFNEDPEWMTMEISAPTSGYVAVGFSPNGAMQGSDILMGWIDSSGKPHIKDLYAVGNSVPLEDDHSDYELLFAEETNDGTTIRFRRPWNTCDTKHDYEITEDTIRLIWAFGELDPIAPSSGNFEPNYHGADFRGVRSVFLKIGTHLFPFPDETLNQADSHIKFWDIRMPNITVESVDTMYYCKIFKVPRIESKHQIIGFRTLITDANKNRVHHINFFECFVPPQHGTADYIFEKYVSHPGGQCYRQNMPPEWGQYCMTVPFVWVAGGEGLMLKKDVGIPLGEEHNGTTYFMLEIHYDNPKLDTFQDQSGVRIFITDEVRKYDAGTITIHSRFGQFQLIPPKATSFLNMAYCTSECTRQVIPPEGITVTHATLHAHLAAKRLIMRHIRNGIELPPIAADDHYDFNYQQTRLVSVPRKILPGDIVLVECEYNTSDRNEITYGGTSTRDEMCQGYIHYYPRVNLANCRTQYEFHNFFDALGIEKVTGEALNIVTQPLKPTHDMKYDPGDDAYILKNNTDGEIKYLFDLINVVSANNDRNITVREYVNNLKWAENNGKLTKKIWKQWWEGKQTALCTAHGFQRIPLKDYIVSYPKYEPYIAPIAKKCLAEGRSRIRLGETSASFSFQNLPVVSATVLIGLIIFSF